MLQDAVWEYFANLEAARQGIDMGVPPIKPKLVAEIEQMDRFGVMPSEGGLEDQPYQRMLELSWVDEILVIRANLAKRNNA